MSRRIFFLAIFAAKLAMGQAAPSATDGPAVTGMETPPPVSGAWYPTAVRADMRSNYLRGGITYTSAYINNLYVGAGNTSLAEKTMGVFPTIDFDATTARQNLIADYSPGFTFYFPSNSLSEVDNSAAVDYDFRLTPHTMIKAVDRFQDSSSPFFPGETDASGTVSGAPASSTPGAVPPFAKLLTNYASLEITKQTGVNTMIGASGLWTTLHYPNPSQAPDLSDSSSRGGTGFYNYRFARMQYIGALYQYLEMQTYPVGAADTTTTSTVMGYYTIYPKAGLSLSVLAGPQHYSVSYPSLPVLASWGPSVTASMGWQGDHSSFAVGYSQSVTGGGGLIGAYHSRSAETAARWRMARTWTGEISGAYSINTSVNSAFSTDSEDGHALSESVTLQHPIRDQLMAGFLYQHVHQSYGGIAAIAPNPDSDRVSVMITWTFLRPLGGR